MTSPPEYVNPADRTVVDGTLPGGDAWLPRAVAAMPRVDWVRGLELARDLLGGEATVHAGTACVLRSTEVLRGLGECPVGVVLERTLADASVVRAVVELDWALTRTVLTRVVGSNVVGANGGGEIPLEPVPLADGERGILLFVAAQLLGEGEPSGWRARTVITTQNSWSTVLGGELCAGIPVAVTGGACRGSARVLLPESATRGLAAAPLGTLLVGETQLSSEELHDAGPGAVVLVDRWLARPTAMGLEGEGLLTFGDSLTAWTGQFQGSRFVVGEHRLRAPAPSEGASVRVDVQVARVPEPAPESGDTVVLAADAAHCLTLAVAGVPWAVGSPVEFEGELGVRIETLLAAR